MIGEELESKACTYCDVHNASTFCQATLLKMGRYYNTTMRHYWDMLVK